MSKTNSSLTANLPGSSDPLPRNPRVHRQLGIPSISRSSKAFSPTFNSPSSATGTSPGGGGTSSGTLVTLKKTAYSMLSKTNVTTNSAVNDPSPSKPPSDAISSRGRFASMPHPLPSAIQAQIDIDNDRRARGIASPPIVDFTRFEDTYRGPRAGNYEGLLINRKPKVDNKSGGMRSRSIGVRPALKANTISPTVHFPETSGKEPHPAAQRKPDPRLVLSSLKDILGVGFEREIDEHLNGHDLLSMHQLDQLEFEERDIVKNDLRRTGKLHVHGKKGVFVVLGESIRKASIYSSTTMVLGGREHELPILVVSCVEELYRTGIYQPNLFRTLPNRSRLLELITIFDSDKQLPGSIIRSRQPSRHKSIPTAGFGSQMSLHLESTPDICALLTTYISSLPEPILSPFLFRPIWDWCGLEDDEAEDVQRHTSSGRRLSSIPLARTYTNPTESNHIHTAQLLLHLLPSPNFSLLVYLLAFFSQVALVREENGVGVDDLSRMFGGRIFGGGSSSASSALNDTSRNTTSGGMDDTTFNTTQTRREGEAMMAWFLRRWAPLSEGLFDVIDDAKMGIFRRTPIRRDSFGKDILSSNLWPTPSDVDISERRNREFAAESQAEGGEGESLFEERVGGEFEGQASLPRDGADEYGSGTQLPRIRVNGRLPVHSTPKSSAQRNSKSLSPTGGDTNRGLDENDYGLLAPHPTEPHGCVDDTLDITQMPSRVESQRVYSLSSLDERLMDVSMSRLLDQTIPTFGSSESDTTTQLRTSPTMTLATPTPTTRGHHIGSQMKPIQACDCASSQLEAQLQERTHSLTEALKEATRYRLKSATLARRVEDLERMLVRVQGEADRDRGSPPIDSVAAATATIINFGAVSGGPAEEGGVKAELEEKLKATEKERDSAKELVSEIKKLMVKD